MIQISDQDFSIKIDLNDKRCQGRSHQKKFFGCYTKQIDMKAI